MQDRPSIGAFYQCYKRPEAVISALSSFRRHYPDSDVYMVCDGGYDYSHLARHFRCEYVHERAKIGNGQSTIPETQEGIIIWLKRLRDAAARIKEDYILLLEDDVLVMDAVREPLKFSINGVNPAMRLGKKITKFLKKRNKSIPFFCFDYHWGGFGGCLFDRKSVLENFNALESDVPLLKQHVHWDKYSSDIWSTLITLYHGGTIGPFRSYCETWYPDYEKRKNELHDISVLHQYKEVYGRELTPEDREILGPHYQIAKEA